MRLPAPRIFVPAKLQAQTVYGAGLRGRAPCAPAVRTSGRSATKTAIVPAARVPTTRRTLAAIRPSSVSRAAPTRIAESAPAAMRVRAAAAHCCACRTWWIRKKASAPLRLPRFCARVRRISAASSSMRAPAARRLARPAVIPARAIPIDRRANRAPAPATLRRTARPDPMRSLAPTTTGRARAFAWTNPASASSTRSSSRAGTR